MSTARHITDYVLEQQSTFAEKPFNPLDSLVLSSISYFNLECAPFDGLDKAPQVLLRDVVEQSDNKLLTQDIWLEYSTRTPDFLRGLAESKRFKDTRVGWYVNEVSGEAEKQFSAVSLVLPHKTSHQPPSQQTNQLTGEQLLSKQNPLQPHQLSNYQSKQPPYQSVYISFRGTDASYVGWKEDFNLGFMEVVPSQVSAHEYVSSVAAKTSGALILGGHSKGGNLAEYAALVTEPAVYERILRVFSHDGPSFLKDPSARIQSSDYNNKLHKTVPAASPIGKVLEKRNVCHVVKSDGISVMQHEPFSWLIAEDDFIYLEKPHKDVTLFVTALNRMVEESTVEERKKLTDVLYELFTSTDTNSWEEFGAHIFENVQRLLSNTSNLDEESKKLLSHFVQLFMKAFADGILPFSTE